MKRLVSILIVIAIILPFGLLSAAKNEEVTVFIDGKQLSFEVEPIVANGTTLVQYTTIFKALGMQSSWDQRTKTVTGFNDYVLMKLTIGESAALVNNRELMLSQAARVVEGRTMVPLRFVSTVTGAKVAWDSNSRKITITSAPARDELSHIMRQHRWNESSAAVAKRESASLINNAADVNNKLSYHAVDWLGYSVLPAYLFNNDRLAELHYQIDLGSASKDEYLLAIGSLYGELSARFGEPFRDEVVFAADDYYDEELDVIAERIATGQAEIGISWQAGYTHLEIIAEGSNGEIVLSVVISNTK